MPFSTTKEDDKAIKIGNALLRNSKKKTGLSSFDVNVTGLTRRGAEVLAQGIAASSRLTALSIQGNQVVITAADDDRYEHAEQQQQQQQEVMEILFRQGILLNPHIATLNLVAPIGHVPALCDVLVSSSSSSSSSSALGCLKLWSSATRHLSAEDMKKLGTAMTNNTSLDELWIGIDDPNSCCYDDAFFSCLAKRTRRFHRIQLRGERSISNPFIATAPTSPTRDVMDEGGSSSSSSSSLLRSLQHLLDTTAHKQQQQQQQLPPRELEIQNFHFPERDWAYLGTSLSTATGLLSLSITNCHLTLTSIQNLSQGICKSNNRSNHHLQTLRLCRNQLGDAGLHVLLSNGLLQNTPNLKTLALVNNQISDVGMTYLAEHFESMGTRSCCCCCSYSSDDNLATTSPPPCPLVHFDLMHNLIGPTGAQQLFQTASRWLPALETLNLADNANIIMGMDNGMAQLLSLLGGGTNLAQLHVKSLDLSWRPSWQLQQKQQQQRDNSVDAAARREAAGKALVKGLESNYYLEELIVSESEFPTTIRKQIAFYMLLNKCGRRQLLQRTTTTTTTTTTTALRATDIAESALIHNDTTNTSDAIWSHVLAKCANNNNNNSSSSRTANNNNMSVLFYFLQQKPELFVGFR